MEIWLDTTDEKTILAAISMGCLHGITTNPSLIAKSGQPLPKILHMLLSIQPGPIAVQVLAKKAEEMIQEAQILMQFSSRFIIKIPATRDGFQAIAALSRMQIPTMATAVFDLYQALLAAKAGASYIAPYFSRMLDAGKNATAIIQNMQQAIERYRFPTKLLNASLRSMEQVELCINMGIDAITVQDSLFGEWLSDHPQTTQCQSRFEKDWQVAKLMQLQHLSCR